MRIAARLAGVLLLAVCLVSCDQAQVLQLQSQIAALSFRATSVSAELLNVWDVIEDSDNDNMPDSGTTPFLFCESIFTGGGPPVTINVNSAPWPHSVKVSILRANGTTFEQVSDVMYLDETSNLSAYDDRVIFGSNNVPKPDVVVLGRTFKWRMARQMSTLNREVVAGTDAVNTLFQLEPATYPYLSGLCSLGDPGPAMLMGQVAPVTFELGKGETIKIEARKALNPPPGLATILAIAAPRLSGDMTIDGVPVGALVTGNSTSGTMPGDGLSFFYSSR